MSKKDLAAEKLFSEDMQRVQFKTVCLQMLSLARTLGGSFDELSNQKRKFYLDTAAVYANLELARVTERSSLKK